jgi:Flp pilus assembly protein TadD
MGQRQRKKRTDGIATSAARRPGAGPSSASLRAKPPFFARAPVWVCLALIAANLMIYSPVRHFEFVTWDDPQYVIQNPHVTSGLTAENIEWALTTGLIYWHPMTWLSHMLDVQLYGVNAGLHHVTNLLLHILSSILLFGLLHQTTGALGKSAFVAALFAVHPLHVESVAWVAERKDVLSTLFWMLTIWAYVWYARQPSTSRYLTVVLGFALALMSKPMVVTLPFVLLLMDFWPLRLLEFGTKFSLRFVWEKIPLLVLAIISSILTFANQKQVGALDLLILPLSRRVANALVSYVVYMRDMVWPAGLAAFYPHHALPVWQVAGSTVVLIGVSAAACRAAKRHPYLPVGWLWYLGTLLPVIGLIQAGDQSRADRFTYVPMIGLFIIIAWLIPDLLWQRVTLPHIKIVLPSAAGLVILACIIAARSQVQYWQSSLTLWGRAAAVTTGNARAHNHLGVALDDIGKVDEAITHYTEAVRIQPDLAEAHTNLGAALTEKGRIDEAIVQYNDALRLKPGAADARNDLAAALESQGRSDEAIQQLLEALKSKPGNPVYHYNVGLVYDRKGDAADALQHFRTALSINPDYQDARRAMNDLVNRTK